MKQYLGCLVLLLLGCGREQPGTVSRPPAAPPSAQQPNQVAPQPHAPNPYVLYFTEIPVGQATYLNLEINDDAQWCQAGNGSSTTAPTYQIDLTLYRTDQAQNYQIPDAATYVVDPNVPDPPATPPASVRVAKVRAYQDDGSAFLIPAGRIVLNTVMYNSPTSASLTGAFTLTPPTGLAFPFAGPTSGNLSALAPCSRLGGAAQ